MGHGLLKFLIVGTCSCVFFLGTAEADNISLASVGTALDSGQYNSNGATLAVSPNLAWADALPGSSWVSFASTGSTTAPGFITVPNGTVVDFFDVFLIPGTPGNGVVQVMADDAAAVVLNGITIMAEATSVGNTYHTCSDFGIGCLGATTIDLPAADMHSGSNTLEFEVAQRDGSSFGLDYLGYVDDPIGTPEPAALILFGTGLLGIAWVVRRALVRN